MRSAELMVFLLSVALLLQVSPARGEEQGLGEFEMWDENSVSKARLVPSASHAPLAQPHVVARASATGQNAKPPAFPKQVLPPVEVSTSSETADPTYLIHFGAGCSWWQPYRVADGATNQMVMPEFSVSLAPFGHFIEVGADLVMGDDSSLLLRPNLKFYSFETSTVSLYLEGAAAIYSTTHRTHFGFGGGIGLVIGLMEHLSLEIRATAVVLNLTEETSTSLFGHPNDQPALIEDLSGLTVFPSIGARTLARF